MTICIAAICEASSKEPKIVICADRLVSAGIQFEHANPKIKVITSDCWVLTSSQDSLKSYEIIKNVRNKAEVELTSTPVTMMNIVELFKKECVAVYKEEVEREVLLKYGLTLDSFHDKSKNLSPKLIEKITEELSRHSQLFPLDFGMSFLIVGFDPEPHMYIVDERGKHELQDFLSFSVIGSGKDLAFSELTKYNIHSNLPFIETMVRVYDAKRISERVPGIGRDTDLLILFPKDGKVTFWEADQQFKTLLDDARLQRQQKEIGILNEDIKKLSELFKPDKTP